MADLNTVRHAIRSLITMQTAYPVKSVLGAGRRITEAALAHFADGFLDLLDGIRKTLIDNLSNLFLVVFHQLAELGGIGYRLFKRCLNQFGLLLGNLFRACGACQTISRLCRIGHRLLEDF